MMKKMLSTLQGVTLDVPALWLMRQAGRYLPEYRATRQRAGGFLDLCFTPELAADVTLQPIRRFDFDAAIVFADILLLPHALGRNLRFSAGEGPQLDPMRNSGTIAGKTLGAALDPVYAALRLVKKELSADKTLIGFCGAPFTVACYMVSGGGSKDFSAAMAYARDQRADFIAILTMLADYSVDYLCQQVMAGADVLQIFESWAGLVAAEDWEDFVLAPTRRIVAGVKKQYPDTPIIGFPRGAGEKLRGFAAKSGVQAVGIDQTVPLDFAAQIQQETIVQGNLAPEVLVAGGKGQSDAVKAIKQVFAGKPYIFNLGHGILPETPLEHVAALVQQVRQV